MRAFHFLNTLDEQFMASRSYSKIVLIWVHLPFTILTYAQRNLP